MNIYNMLLLIVVVIFLIIGLDMLKHQKAKFIDFAFSQTLVIVVAYLLAIK